MENKYIIDGILVVEGKSDVEFLSNFLDCEFIITNGSEISSDTISLIKSLSQNKNIIVLTDPDSPGKRIRDIINREVDGCYNAFIRKELSIRKNKVGVAESTKEEVLKSLQNIHLFKRNNEKPLITYKDLIIFGYLALDNKKFRTFLANKYGFDVVNTKTLIKRINMLNIPIEKEIKDYGRE